MAPFEQPREIIVIHRVELLQDASTDELRIEARSRQRGNKNDKHAGRDIYGNGPNYVDDSSSASTSATSSPSLSTSISYENQPSSSSTLLSSVPTTTSSTSSMPTNSSLSTLPTASSNQNGMVVDPATSISASATSNSSPSSAISSAPSHTTSSVPAALSQTAAAAAAAAAATTSTSAPTVTDTENHSLSPTAQHVLISAATIGAIIFIGTIIYCILRFLKIDVVSRIRRFTRRGRGSWRPGSFSGTENYAPPYATLSDEKNIPSIRKPYAPIVIEPVQMAVLPSAQELARADTERQKLVREALLSKLEDTALYHETLQSRPRPEPQPARQPSVAYTNNRPYSELSSLSSGFGDAKIDIPESGPTKPNSQRKSRASRASQKDINYSRFSWSSSPTTLGRGRGNRDTIYTSTTTHTTLTTSSEESGPRFRTVNSWVSHQAKRVQRQKEHDREIDSMPALPAQAHVKRAHHQRLQSEITDPGFKYHPGDEVPLANGNRVPSAILDKII